MILSIGLLAFLISTGCSNYLVKKVAFHPTRTPASISELRAENVREIRVPTRDRQLLQAFHFTQKGSDKVVLFFHGNAGNAYHRLADAKRLSEAGCNVLLLSYRGYGKSTGSPSERGVYEDAESALRYAREVLGYQTENTFLLGRSIGSAVAVNAAQHQPLAGLILVTPLSSGSEMAKQLGLNWMLLTAKPFDSLSKIRNVRCPLLVIHGDRDRVIPLQQGMAIAKAHLGPREIHIVRGADHNDLIQVAGDRYWNLIAEFLADPKSSD